MLEQFLVTEIFAFLLIFTRIGAGMMVMPGISEAYVNIRSRLLFALIVSLAMLPVISDLFPDQPGTPLSLVVLLVAEAMVGLFMGWMARFLIAVTHIAGTLISFQASLALATVFDASQGSQTTVIGNFIHLTAMTLFFLLDLHHVMFQGLFDSYTLFPPGQMPPVDDFANQASRMMMEVFRMGAQLAAPHMMVAMLVYLGAGILGRLMPQMQIFFVIMPLQIAIALFVLMAIFADIQFTYMEFAENTLQGFLGQ